VSVAAAAANRRHHHQNLSISLCLPLSIDLRRAVISMIFDAILIGDGAPIFPGIIATRGGRKKTTKKKLAENRQFDAATLTTNY